jgi:hypothetical protein
MAMVEESFRGTTVAELLAQPGNVTPLCEETKVITISTKMARNASAKKTAMKTAKKVKKSKRRKSAKK